MSELLIRHSSLPSRPHNPPDVPNRLKPKLIEISDDDSDPPAPTGRVKPRRIIHFRPKPPVMTLSDSDSDWNSDSDSPVRKRGQPVPKRPKLDHLPNDGAKKAGSLTQNSVKAEPTGRRSLQLDRPLSVRSTLPSSEPHRATQAGPSIKVVQNPLPRIKNVRKKPVPDQAQPPYYFDAKLDSRMYRGVGYEKFPVVLGTVDGHQEICDHWDARLLATNRKKQEKQRLMNPDGSLQTVQISSSSESDEDTGSIPTGDQLRCLQDVLDVLPDIDPEFVLQKVKVQIRLLNAKHDKEVQELPSIANIVSQILDMDEYPKAKPRSSQSTTPVLQDEEAGMTISWNRSALKNPSYIKDAIILLAGQFDHVPTHYISKIVGEKRSVFDTYIYVRKLDESYYTAGHRPYRRLPQPRMALEKKYYTRTMIERRNADQYSQMVNELQAAKQHAAREAIKLDKQKQDADVEATNLAIHKAMGSIVECQCCFDDEIPINRSVSCESDTIHFFCFGCVVQLAETQIGAMKFEMRCMDGSGCKAMLSTEGIGRAVPLKTFDKLALNQQQAEIAAAGIEGLEQCPFCDFKAICEPIEFDSVFNCQNPDCGRATCRRCSADAHLPKSCEEVKADRGLSARHLVEEARSEAMMRTCPKCKVKIVKELGCNKMRCTTCNCLMCYVCKADISQGKEGGYEHFNKAGARCKLYDDNGVDRHDIEADDAEKVAIQKAKATHAELDEDQLKVGKSMEQLKTQPNLPGQAQIPGAIMGNLQNQHAAGVAAAQHIMNQAQALQQQQIMLQQAFLERVRHGGQLQQAVQPAAGVMAQFPALPIMQRGRFENPHGFMVAHAQNWAPLPQPGQPYINGFVPQPNFVAPVNQNPVFPGNFLLGEVEAAGDQDGLGQFDNEDDEVVWHPADEIPLGIRAHEDYLRRQLEQDGEW